MRFRKDFIPHEDVLRRVAFERGYEIAGGSISISFQDGQPEWRFIAVEIGNKAAPISELATELTRFEGVENYSLSRARN